MIAGTYQTSYGVGQYVASEGHSYVARRNFRAGTDTAAIYGHGYGADATQLFSVWSYFSGFADYGIVLIGADLGGISTWGNDTVASRVGSLVTFAQSASVGAKAGKVYLIGSSMGCSSVLSWAKNNVASVRAIALTNPVVDIADVHDNNRNGYASAIETAYGGLAAYNAAIPTHNPVGYASSLAGIPIRCWGGSDDPIATPAAVSNFVANVGKSASSVNMGTVGHTLPTPFFSQIAAWLAAQ